MQLFPAHLRSILKASAKRWIASLNQRFRGFGKEQLAEALGALGVRQGDVVMLHSAFSPKSGFRGGCDDLVGAFLSAIGPSGHLLMVSLPYRGATIDWLESGRRFDVRKTPSMMGLVSESFRRRPDVVRSLHPTHPVLAHGPRARQIIETHAACLHPCGRGSPFDQLANADGKVVFFDVPIDTFTFFHYLEDLVSPALPFDLYTQHVYEVPVIDESGAMRTVRTHAFAREAIRRRRPERIYDALRRDGKLATRRVGAAQLLCVRVRDAIDCTQSMMQRGEFFYELGDLSGSQR
jgi:aminoglycoside 3-N-acetyltransferase